MKKYLVPLFVLIFSVNAFAANHYIRAGATGANNGSSWTNAWTNFSSVTWRKGDTYYVAGGWYAGNVSISSASGAGWITIKKANASDNGSDLDWNSSYAADQAVIDGNIAINVGSVEIDGVTGSGSSGHGIKIHPSTSVSVINLGNNTGPYHLYHLELEGPGFDYGSLGVDGIYYNVGIKGFRVAYCYIHEIPRNGVTIGTNVGTSFSDYGMLFENNVIERTGGVAIAYPDLHGQGMQIGYNADVAYLIIRNNIFKNLIGTGMIAYLGAASSHTYNRIYNNIFLITDLGMYNTISPGVIVTLASGAVNDYFYIYNNTFYGLGNGGGVYGRIYLTSSATITIAEVKNNLWVNSYLPYGGYLTGITSSSNNGFYNNNGSSNPGNTESGDPFINSAGNDFRLKSTANARDKGFDLSSVFTTDIVGATRPQGSAWDIGAYEYYTGPNPSPPVNLKIVP
jgi:hypothetical protein